MKKPKHVDLTPLEANALLERIETNSLTKDDLKLITGVISFNLWLQSKLKEATLSIKRLRMIFGVKTEKKRI